MYVAYAAMNMIRQWVIRITGSRRERHLKIFRKTGYARFAVSARISSKKHKEKVTPGADRTCRRIFLK